jgi:hypothetical protein
MRISEKLVVTKRCTEEGTDTVGKQAGKQESHAGSRAGPSIQADIRGTSATKPAPDIMLLAALPKEGLYRAETKQKWGKWLGY